MLYNINNADKLDMTNMSTNDKYIYIVNRINEMMPAILEELEIEDLKAEPQGPFKAMLKLVGASLFNKHNKYILYDDNNFNNNDNVPVHKFNTDLLDMLCDYYIMLCNKYKKLVSIEGYTYLLNIDYSTIEKWKSFDVTSKNVKIYKKIISDRERCLKDKCYDSNNVVGTITLGNTEYNWQTGAVAVGEKKQLQLDSLPTFTSNQIEKK